MSKHDRWLRLAIIGLLVLAIVFSTPLLWIFVGPLPAVLTGLPGAAATVLLFFYFQKQEKPASPEPNKHQKASFEPGTISRERRKVENELQEGISKAFFLDRDTDASQSAFQPTAILDAICRELALALKTPAAVVLLKDNRADTLTVAAQYCEPGCKSTVGTVISVESSPAVQQLMNQSVSTFTLNLDSNGVPEPIREVMKERGTSSAFLIPVFTGRNLVGLLELDTRAPKIFNEKETELAHKTAAAVSHILGISRLNASLFQELGARKVIEEALNQRERYLAALMEMQTVFVKTNDPESALKKSIEIIGEAAQAKSCSYYEVVEGSEIEALELHHHWCCAAPLPAGQPVHNAFEDYPQIIQKKDHLELWEQLERGSAIHLPGVDATGDHGQDNIAYPFAANRGCLAAGTRARLLLPVSGGTRLYGLLVIEELDDTHIWATSEVDMIKVAAAMIALEEERRIVTNALAKEQIFALKVMNSMNQGLTVTGTNGEYSYANPAFAEMLGYEPDAIIRHRPEEFIIPEDQESYQNYIREGENGLSNELEVRMVNSTGQIIEAMISRVPNMKSSEFLGSIEVVTDLTDRKNVESVLRCNEEFLRGIYNITASQELPFYEKIQGLLIFGAQHFDMLSGFLAKKEADHYIIIENYTIIRDFELDEELKAVKPVSDLVIQGREPLGIEDIENSDRTECRPCIDAGIYAYLAAPVYSGSEVYGILCFLALEPRKLEFTPSEIEFIRLMAQWVGGELEREEYVEQLQKYTEEIAQTNHELALARDQAIEVSRFKSDFLATMSHEIRTPMNAVIGMTELLLGTTLNLEQREYTTIIQDSAQVLLTLINDILDFSKIEAGKMLLESYDFDLQSVVEGAVDLFLPRAHEKELDLMAYVSPSVPQVLKGDPVRLRQVLINLISNAIKFTSKGHIFVRVSLESENDDKTLIHFQVQDTGIGLSFDARQKLFQPFTQADESTARKYGGTGLGLAISRSLVELMNGSIGVESVIHEGSTFWFSIPFEKTESQQNLVQDNNALMNSKALIASAEGFHRDFVIRCLNGWGARTAVTADPIDALWKLTEGLRDDDPFDLVLIDMDLPGMNGFELGDSISRQEDIEAVPKILFIDAHQRQEGENALAAGFAAIMNKPVKQSQLFGTLTKVLRGEAVETITESAAIDLWPVIEPLIPEDLVEELTKPKPFVLLAEDNVANQRLAIIQLKKLGYDAEAVFTGTEAVKMVSENPGKYAVVLMDCQMPEMDGFMATQMIRQHEKGTGIHIPIIAMTANAMQGDREACVAAGMDDYMSKPIRLGELSKVISKWSSSAETDSTNTHQTKTMGQGTGRLDAEIIAGIRSLQSDGEPDFLSELIDLYLAESKNLVEGIHEAISECESEQLKRTAHSLKGTSINLGARSLASYCTELERCAVEGRFDEAASLFNTFILEYQDVCKALINEKHSSPF